MPARPNLTAPIWGTITTDWQEIDAVGMFLRLQDGDLWCASVDAETNERNDDACPVESYPV